MVCVMRAGHPAAAGTITVSGFLASRHVRVSISPTDQRFVDNILAQMSLTRDIALQLQHWTLLPAVLKESDLLSVMPESFARGFGPDYAVRPLPFASSEFVWKVYWHRRHGGNPGIGWLADLIAACGGSLPEAGTSRSGA
jgi:DNA-binding transcriptional LysR family regulator